MFTLLSSPVVDIVLKIRKLCHQPETFNPKSWYHRNLISKSYKWWIIALQMHQFWVNNIWLKQILLTWMSNCSHCKLYLLSLSGFCQLWRLRGGVEYWGAGMSPFYHVDRKILYLACPSVSQGLIYFVPIQTQVMSWPLLQKTNDVSNAKSLCRLAWQPGAGKVSDAALDWQSLPSSPHSDLTWTFLCVRSVFSSSCRVKGAPVWARVLESCEHSVRWSADTGEVQVHINSHVHG